MHPGIRVHRSWWSSKLPRYLHHQSVAILWTKLVMSEATESGRSLILQTCSKYIIQHWIPILLHLTILEGKHKQIRSWFIRIISEIPLSHYAWRHRKHDMFLMVMLTSEDGNGISGRLSWAVDRSWILRDELELFTLKKVERSSGSENSIR